MKKVEETSVEVVKSKRGGFRVGAGRKTKGDEQKAVEKLTSIIGDDLVVGKLKTLIEKGDFRAIQLYFNYRYGKPKEDVTVNSEGFSIDFKSLFR